MKNSRYEVIAKVFELKNITKAAESLNYTQSAVSQIIHNFEKELGFTIVVRSKQGIKLTECGERIKEPIYRIVNGERNLKEIADSIIGIEEGVLRIGVFQSVSMQWLPSIIKEFSLLYPNIEYELVYGDYAEINENLKRDNLNCGFNVESEHSDIVFLPLIKDEFMVVLPANHPFTKYKSIPFHKLDNEDFIYSAEGEDFDLGDIIRATGIHPKIRLRSEDDYAAVAMVEQGLGVCVLPSLILEAIDSDVVIRPLKEHYYRTLGIGVHSIQYASPLTRTFIDFIIDWVSLRYKTD